MQIFVGYATRDGAPEAGARRVEARYGRRWSSPPRRRHAASASAGVLLWQGAPVSRWPAWAQDGSTTVTSLYAPVGYDRVVAAEPLADAPLRLARALAADPSAVEQLCPPFVCAALDSTSDRLTLHTDAVGVGRLFEVRMPTGWVWSNRPEAALAFADLPARADEIGWQHIAVADELFGQTTAYEGVRVIDAATTIRWDGRAGRLDVSAIDTVAGWAPADAAGQTRELIEAAADQLVGIAGSVNRLYEQPPVVDLTGGRDSRLVAAAFLAAGADVTLHTHDALPGDLATARELVALLEDPPPHRIEHVATGGVGAPRPWAALRNARGWHAFAEGLRPYSYLHHDAPAHLDIPRPPAIGGAGGEVAHGYFYPGGRARLESLPHPAMLAAFADAVVARYAPAPGAHPDARALVRSRIETTLTDIAERGYRDAACLDVFYLRERIRRWGSTGERPGVVSPLLAPSFLRACLSLTPDERSANSLHRELTRRLAPRWADVPYFPGEQPVVPAARPAPPRVVRVADATDRELVEALLHDTPAWAAAFDEPRVQALWAQSLAGVTTAAQERVLRAVVWRGAFADHLAELRGERVVRTPRPIVAIPETLTAPTAGTERGRPREGVGPGAQRVTAIPDGETGSRTGGAPSGSRATAAATPAPPPLQADLARVAALQAESGRLLTRAVARRFARSRPWQMVRDTPTGAFVRRGAASARRRGLRL